VLLRHRSKIASMADDQQGLIMADTGPAKSRGAGRPSTPIVMREAVINAAIEMIDADGTDNFSIRKLAKSMGVTSPTIYHHFGDRNGLLEAAVRHLVRELKVPAPQRTWQDYFLESTRSYRKILKDHPNMVPMFATRPWRDSQHLVINETLRLLDEGGVPAHLQMLMLRASEILAVGSGVLAGRLNDEIYGDVADEYTYLRRAIEEDGYNEQDSFDAVCRAVVTGLTGSVIAGMKP
jgi:TetR/AcrR family tetracycline transcriptional repressor